jgi:ABC-type branched-subunit amino acid transport system substrate-binding protein
MRKTAWYRLLALLFGFTLIAAACGSDGDTEAGGTSDEEASESADEEAAPEDDGETGGAADQDATDEAMEESQSGDGEEASAGDKPTTLDEWQALWASEREAIVASIVDGGYGLGEDGVLTGPGGFTLDTNACPSDWSNTEGIEDGVIKIAQTTAQSGNLAVYGNLNLGMDIYFEWLNENGGIGDAGYQIETIIKDDGYVADLTIEFVAELLQSDKPFAINTLGSPNTFAVYNTLNDACVPQPMVWTGHQAWGDPEGHPWTTGMQMSYATESLLWGSWIDQNFDEPVKVAALVMDNDFGLAYEQGFAEYAANNPDVISEVEFVRHDPAAATLTNEITTLAAEEPNVFISMTAGNPCLLAIQEAFRAGLTETADAVFTPSVCKAVASYMAPAGDAADGWYIIGGGLKDTTDPQWEEDLWISFANEQIEERGGDPEISLQGQGFAERGWAFEQVLRIADALPDGLNRTNMILAQRGMTKMSHPALLDGIGFGMNGNEDAYFIEGSDISVFSAGSQSWNKEGDVIDLSGLSPNCPWVAGEGC